MTEDKSMKHKAAERLQYGALPYRVTDDVEVMLISSRETKRWVIPKGWPIKGKKPHVSASIEAFEEAGLVGEADNHAIGAFYYVKRLKGGDEALCKVDVFPLKVKGQAVSWPEKKQRTCSWFPIAEAAELVQEPELRDLLFRFRTKVEKRKLKKAS
jgi:8-oxo-dGTP pyrophosphatase MutT (NUDIX family)